MIVHEAVHSVIDMRTDHAEGAVLHVCNGLDPRRDGGMVPSILGMTGSLAGRGWDIQIVTPTPSRLPMNQVPRGVVLNGPEADLEGFVRDAEVVHIHGLWQEHTRRAARTARLHRVPHMMVAHGMADPWALGQKAWKKRIYALLVENGNLRRATCLHALTRPEVGHLRAMAPSVPVALVPNGVDLTAFDDLPQREQLERDHPELRGRFILLFFGRLHKKKGLDLLASALASAARDYPDLHLLLAGTDGGALASFLTSAESLGIRSRITHVGHVSGEVARRVWGAADGFILPSHSEGFSMAVLEALGARVPAIITSACNFPELARERAGIVVEPTVEGVECGLRELLQRSPEERRALGRAGRLLVESQYTWQRQAARLADVYAWMTGGGAKPEAIEQAS